MSTLNSSFTDPAAGNMARVAGISRRGLLGAGMAGIAALPPRLFGETSAPSPQASAFRNPYVYRFNIGELEAYSISDCNLSLREGLGLMWPEEARPAMREELARHGETGDTLPLYVNILVVKAGNEIALFDSGFGFNGNAKMGWLMEGLALAGIAPERVTAAFLSHSHSDHLNGFVKDGKPAFANAAVHLLPAELAFWRGPNPDFSKSKRDKKPLPGMVKEVNRNFDILGQSLQVVPEGAELFGGKIRVEAAPGHTDGHACFRIRSGNEELLHLTDLAHHPLLMFANPEWTIAFDHNPVQSVVTRKKYWREAAAKHTRCYGFHLPWPGLGTIVSNSETNYQWWPEPAKWIG